MEVDRSAFLRSKKAELNGIVTSRKRKLRELFAVSESELQLPVHSFKDPEVPATSAAEARFLEVTDILQDRLFDESNLPSRRQLRSDTSKPRSPIRKSPPDGRSNDALRKGTKLQRDRSTSSKSRAPTPSPRRDGTPSATLQNGVDRNVSQGLLMQRSSSKGSQTDLPAEASMVLNGIVEETFENVTQPRSSPLDAAIPAKDLEGERIRTRVESRPSSPGVDPRKAMPISPEDAANLNEPLIPGLGSRDGHYKAATVHLPPQEVQEEHEREVQKARRQRDSHLSIHPPPRDVSRSADALSSPGSTIDAQSATTPAMHDVSTDTSPENDSSRYDAERANGKEEDIPTPPELRHTSEELAEKVEHDRLLQGQIDASRAHIMRDSPREVGSASSNATGIVDEMGDPQMEDSRSEAGQSQSGDLTKEAGEVVDDVLDDRENTNAQVPVGCGIVGAQSKSQLGTPKEIADSEEDLSPSANAMEVENRTVKDSFESASGTENEPRPVSKPPGPSSNSGDESGDPTATLPIPMPRGAPSIPPPPPAAERMTTRVLSGAMRHKSVSEILGETPKPSSSSVSAKGDSDSARNSASPSRSGTPQSPGARRSLIEKAREKERSKLSTVIFPKQPPKALDPARAGNGMAPPQDYFNPLFLATSSVEKRGGPTLDNLLATAHKTITTANAYVPIIESQTAKILKRIYSLQVSNKWSLRQPKRSEEVVRPTSHWDVLLQEAKWMRTDFREERKWKMAVARNLAYACAEWVDSDLEDRKLLQVKSTTPATHSKDSAADADMGEGSSQAGAHPTPDLVTSGDSPMDDLDEEPRLNLFETVSPTAIFGLQDDDVVFGLRRSPTTDKLLNELPIYGAPLMVPRSDLPTSDIDPDRFWRRPALPLSKFVEGRLELKMDPPPRKKSRYEYDLEDEDEDHVVFGEARAKAPVLPPENSDVALFDPQHKHIRDRLHSTHHFRPPSEYPMPPQSFYENRSSSQWTWDEDNELKNLVREYSYNWGLISGLLTSKSLFSSGAERRTPWECFERWVQTEGMPADMGRTQYFRMYTNRIDQANRNVLAQAQAAPAPNVNGQVQPPPRRRPTSSIRVDRRRNQKHLTLVDAMRKLAKKRETNLQKQQHAQGMAAMRKANEAPHPANRPIPATTPQDFSRIKHEREEQFKERVVQMQQRQEQQRRLNEIQRRNGTNPQQAGLPSGGPPRPPTSSAMAPNGTPTSSQNLTVPGQNRPPPRPMPQQMPGQPPAGFRVPQMPMGSVPAASMQGQLPLPNPSLDVGLVTRAHQISQNQQAILRQQQGQLPGQSPQMHNSPPRTNGVPQPGFPIPNMMPPYNTNGSAVGTPPPNSHSQSPGGQAGSPRMGQHGMNMVPSNIPHVKMLEQQIMTKYPTATPDQVMRLIQVELAKSVQQQQQRQGLAQSAMNAAAGGASGNNMAAMSGMAGQGTPQLYAQQLRQQQENQQKAQRAQMQAANAIGNGQAQGQGNPTGNAAQGHAHRGSPPSVQNGN